MDKYYKPSGKFSPTSFLYFILGLLVAIPILSVIYTYLVWYIPFIYINFFITIGLGMGVSMIVSTVIKTGKVRNPTLSVLFGLTSGVFAVYIAYAVWVVLLINAGETSDSDFAITSTHLNFSQLLNVVLSPGPLFEMIGNINEIGTWGFGSSSVNGILLSVIWAIEFLIVVILTVIGSWDYSKRPFCEFNNSWFEENVLAAFNIIRDPNLLKSNIESNSVNSFDDIYLEPDARISHHSIFTLYSSLQGENFLSVSNKIAKVDDKNSISFDDQDFIEYIQLDVNLKELLLERQNKQKIEETSTDEEQQSDDI